MYEGHLPDGSGIQRHSAGLIYPYVILARQKSDSLEWGIIGPDTGGYLWFGSRDDAVRAADIYKSNFDRRQTTSQRAAVAAASEEFRSTLARILEHNQREWDRFSLQRG